MRSAVIVIDMVNDFVNGVFGSEEAVDLAKKFPSFLEKIGDSAEIIFTLDTHINFDPEFKVWGEHCLIGTKASELVDELRGVEGYKITKRHYDAFFDTDLDGYLRARGVNRIFLSGVSTDICVLHTAAGAFFRHYDVSIIKDFCAAIDPAKHEEALSFIKRNYGSNIITSIEALEVI
ncbi:MAG: cysteine hydrolase [Candidatus Thermoplasmatota archaeon]|nr:cysteine hydrolase [Candidatus Thermoplasmatota archaeon]MDA8143335.1 cysteine hydrolase [Thermoplasmatales archaeon]